MYETWKSSQVALSVCVIPVSIVVSSYHFLLLLIVWVFFHLGVVGGSLYTSTGAAVNALCLTLTPQFDNATTTHWTASLYGAEYEHIPSHINYDVPCAVCRVPQSTTIMMAATLTCPSGWTPQYTGHIVAGYPGHNAASEYRCLDGQPENVARSHQDSYGFLLYYTVAQCGSLPCGPYIQGKIITCVVCSM